VVGAAAAAPASSDQPRSDERFSCAPSSPESSYEESSGELSDELSSNGLRVAAGRTDRRTMLRRAGAALVGAASAATVAGALETTAARPAAAVDGLPLLLGNVAGNTATSPTGITYSAAALAANIFTVTDGDVVGLAGAAIAGVATAVPDSSSAGRSAPVSPTAPDDDPLAAGAPGAGATVGVVGLSDVETGAGVYGWGRGANAIGVVAAGNRAGLRIIPSTGDPRTGVGTHAFGELDVDVMGNLWVCVAGGQPGTWRKLAGADSTGTLHLLPSPSRVYDSRVGFPPTDVAKGALANDEERVIDATIHDGAPPLSLAALINLTATGTNSAGWLAAFKNGIPFPGTSTLNWSAPGSNVANSAIVALDSLGRFVVRCAGATHIAVDVVGYLY
jgi:hypothetical protein